MEIKRPSHICAGAVFFAAGAPKFVFVEKVGGCRLALAALRLIDLALALEGVALRLRTCLGTASSYVDSCCTTFAVFIVGTVVGFTVNLDGFTSTAVFGAVHSSLASFTEASAGCFIGTSGTVAHHINLPSGAEHIFVVSTGCCGTF